MGVKIYEKRIQVSAIKFQGFPPQDPNHMNDVMSFVEKEVQLNFTAEGIQLRIVINPLNVLVVKTGDYVVKDIGGNLRHMTKAAFEAEYTEVTG